MKKFAITVDLGGTNWRVALINRDGKILERFNGATSSKSDPDDILLEISIVTKQIFDKYNKADISGIGICLPGPVNNLSDEDFFLTNLPRWKDMPLKSLFRKYFDLPLYFENDANAALLGEFHHGVGQGFSDVVYITVSTGVGSACISNYKLITGFQGKALEIGHIPVDPTGPLCGCGGSGHLETLASGTAIAKEMTMSLRMGYESSLSDKSEVTGKDVVLAAQNGDTLANDVLRKAGRYLGFGLSTVIHLFNPERIIIGGGISNAGPLLIDPAIDILKHQLMPTFHDTFDIVKSELGDDNGLFGMSSVVFSHNI